MNRKTRLLLPAFALFVGAALLARADVNAQVVLADGDGRPVPCSIRWLPVDKVYNVTMKAEGNPQRRVKPEAILKMRVEPPKGWSEIAKRAAADPKAATGPLRGQLEQIAGNYKMLQYDGEAGKLIAEGFLKQNNPNGAIDACKKIMAGNKDAGWNSAMAPAYWQALLDANKIGEVQPLLDKGVTASEQAVSMMACIRRGDLYMKKNEPKLALKDGYLRAVLLYRDQGEARAEALYRAGEAFEKAGQNTYAERMRDELRSKYSRTSWGKKLLGG